MFFFLLLVFCTTPQAAALGPVEAMVQVAKESEHFWKFIDRSNYNFWFMKPLLPEKLRPPGQKFEISRNYFQLLKLRHTNKLTQNYKNYTPYAQSANESIGDSVAPISQILNDLFDFHSHFFSNHSNFEKNSTSQFHAKYSIEQKEITKKNSQSEIHFKDITSNRKLNNWNISTYTTKIQQKHKNERCINRLFNVQFTSTLHWFIRTFHEKTRIGLLLLFILLCRFPGNFRELAQVARSYCQFSYDTDQIFRGESSFK